MDKDKIVNALNAIQNSSDGIKFHDELQVAIGVMMETSEDDIAAVNQDIHEDDEDDEDKGLRASLVLLKALDAVMGGAEAGEYWDELITIRLILVDTPFETIAAAKKELDDKLEEALED